MYLKRIELVGFKSFAERTRFEFDSNIVGIVGPNGCGKSNIVDAIRWCLGEQSSSSLRSRLMLDVIFNGTQTRPATSMAEVSITVDNEDKILPIEFSEVTITRRLFRSGESEYYINKTPCRLKDIRELFLDTGIGAEGYSITEQGKVEFVMSAKPEERRALFEEAAGVAKYKTRREESIRKLERVRENMSRVNDMLAWYKEQMNTLENAVRKARKYQQHQEELKALEIAAILYGIDSSETKLIPLKENILSLSDTLQQVNTKLVLLETDLSKLKFEYTTLDQEYYTLQKQLNDLDKSITHSEARKAYAETTVKDCTTICESFVEQIKTLQAKKINIKETQKNISQQLTDLEQKITVLVKTIKEKDDSLSKLKCAHKEKYGIEKNINDRLFEIATKKAETRNMLSKISSEINNVSIKIATLQKNIKKANIEKINTENEINSISEQLNSKKHTFTELKKKYHHILNLKEEVDKKQSLLLDEKAIIDEKYYTIKAKLSTIEEISKKDPELHAIQAILSQNWKGIYGPVRHLLKISPLYEKTIKQALGKKLDFLVTETIQEAQQAIHYLKEHKIGRATFVILDKLPDVEEKKFVSTLKGEKPIISLIHYDKKWDKLMKFLTNATYYSGNTIFSEGIIQGGIDIEEEKISLWVKENLIEEIQKLEAKKKTIEEELNSIKEQINKFDLEKIATEMNSLEHDIATLTQQCEEKYSLLKVISQEITFNSSEISNLEMQQEELKNSLKSTEAELKKFEKIELELSAARQNYENETLSLQGECDSMNTELMTLKTDLSTAQAKIEMILSEQKRLNEEYETAIKDIASLEEKIKINQEKITEQKHIQKQETENIDNYYKEQELIQKLLQEVNTKRTEINNLIEEKETQINLCRREVNSLQENLHKEELTKKSLESEKKNLEHQLNTKFNITLEEAKAKFGNIEYSEEKIYSLRKKLDSFGMVNLAAEEQYTELQQRYNSIIAQQQDLLKADEDLRQTITRINAAIRENFRDTFDKVCANFKKIYTQLFDGGEANLVMTDANDLLETGIEIYAQPPGKKLQNISLLSGGEKALTAIALLFAFYMVKPSPFSILDEVDASLDEPNTVKFTKMIKNYAQNSQFIIITHNPRTIAEIAETLYGITMEEQGISKIYSVKLRKEPTLAPTLTSALTK